MFVSLQPVSAPALLLVHCRRRRPALLLALAAALLTVCTLQGEITSVQLADNLSNNMSSRVESKGGWQPGPAPLMTRWGREVNPATSAPHPEYPRPDLAREKWLSLNGLWQFGVIAEGVPIPATLPEVILVPFCVESALSGVMQAVGPEDRMVYQRQFSLPASWTGGRVRLNFEAVDWDAEVWVDGQKVGRHTGGYNAWGVDIEGVLGEGSEHSVTVVVRDPTEKEPNPVGKQWAGGERDSGFIFYTATSGIWQSVWLEPLPATAVERLTITSDIDRSALELTVHTSGGAGRAAVTVTRAGDTVLQSQVDTDAKVWLELDECVLWSPANPVLYTLVVTMLQGGEDSVTARFGMRKIEMRKIGKFQRIFLNNELLEFQLGPLDQGYWPDGLLTPPSEAALLWDLQQTKNLGFNMVRKHIKVESRRWYHHADSLGLLVWQDFPAISDKQRPGDSPAAASNWALEWGKWLQQLHNHPAIIVWVVFNEAWGQFDTVEVTPVLLLCCAALVQYAPGDQGGDGGGREQAGDRGQRLDRLPGGPPGGRTRLPGPQ